MTKVFFELRLLAQNIQSLLTVVRCPLSKKKDVSTCVYFQGNVDASLQ